MTLKEFFIDYGLGASGWMALLGKQGYDYMKLREDRKKSRADAGAVNVDTDIKQYSAWQNAYAQITIDFGKLSQRIIEIEKQNLEQTVKILQMESDQVSLQQENMRMKITIKDLSEQVEEGRRRYDQLHEEYLKLKNTL